MAHNLKVTEEQVLAYLSQQIPSITKKLNSEKDVVIKKT